MHDAPVSGSCLCGGVRFEIDGILTPIQYCHATRCRKASGSAFAAEAAARASDLRWTRGADLVSVFEAPLLREPPAYRHAFCHIFVGQNPGWHLITDDLPRFDGRAPRGHGLPRPPS